MLRHMWSREVVDGSVNDGFGSALRAWTARGSRRAPPLRGGERTGKMRPLFYIRDGTARMSNLSHSLRSFPASNPDGCHSWLVTFVSRTRVGPPGFEPGSRAPKARSIPG